MNENSDVVQMENLLRNPPVDWERVKRRLRDQPELAEIALQNTIDWELEKSPDQVDVDRVDWYVQLLLEIQEMLFAPAAGRPQAATEADNVVYYNANREPTQTVDLSHIGENKTLAELLAEIQAITIDPFAKIEASKGDFVVKNQLTLAAEPETETVTETEPETEIVTEAEPKTEITAEAQPQTDSSPAKPAKPVEVKRKHKKALRRTLLIAAIFTALATCTLAVSANTSETPFDFDDKFVSVVEHMFQADFNKADATPITYTDTDNKLVQTLNENGFDSLVLPKALLSGGWTVEDITYDHQEFIDIAVVKLNHPDYKVPASIAISREKNHEHPLNRNNTYLHITKGKELNVNGVDLLLLEHKRATAIYYSDEVTRIDYSITLPYTDFELGEEVAKSIG